MTFHSHILPEHDVRPYSIAQLADRWGCSDSMIRKLINQGQLQTFRIGALIRVSAAEVERYEKCPVNPVPIQSSDSEADSPSSIGSKRKGTTSRSAIVHSSPRKIGRAPRRKPANAGKAETIVRGPWNGS
ncbi:MAG: helix-turn-helix domain-containing protein [Sphingopyxis sp.]|nr:helix-turn-helix domain-containing protein [Sphingopyxis sp.]